VFVENYLRVARKTSKYDGDEIDNHTQTHLYICTQSHKHTHKKNTLSPRLFRLLVVCSLLFLLIHC